MMSASKRAKEKAVRRETETIEDPGAFLDMPFKDAYVPLVMSSLSDYRSHVDTDMSKAYEHLAAAGSVLEERELNDEELRQQLRTMVMSLDDIQAKLGLTAQATNEVRQQMREEPEKSKNLWKGLDAARNLHYNVYIERSFPDKYKMSRYYPRFARQMHEIRHPEEEDDEFMIDRHLIQLARTMGDGSAGAGDSHTADMDDGEDMELIMGRSTQSDRCPLTLKPMTEPYKSRVCNHRFEKGAIIGYIKNKSSRHHPGQAVKCPVSGCPRSFTLNDFALDEGLLRRRRALQQRRENRTSEDEGSGPEDTSEGRRNGASGRRVIEDDEDGDEIV